MHINRDREGRDRAVSWMQALELTITIADLVNVVGTRPGLEAAPPIMTGSHIVTVATEGRYNGTLGVLAGLEVIATLNERQIQTRHPLYR